MSACRPKRLTIQVTEGDTLSVSIKDTGQGVENMEKIFDPFYSTKEVGASEGMGLGLSISYGIMQSFGGNIRVRNCLPGAVFTVELRPWQAQKAV